MSDNFKTLEGTYKAVWTCLVAGGRDGIGPARTPVLATKGTLGGASARLVILRDVDETNKTLTFFTNKSSLKVAELESDPALELLIWDADASFQIRLKCSATLAPVDPETWSKLGSGARLNYASSPAPGTVLGDPSEAWAAKTAIDQMTKIVAHVLSIETLHIGREGLRRARFENGRSQWIAP